jgi:ATP-binding cassette subfamily C protein
LTAALRDCRSAFWGVATLSAVVNLLMLAGPIYMLQVYDRVLTSRSVPTLVALTIFLVGAYAFQAALDIVRSRIVVRAAALLDWHLATTVHEAVIQLAGRGRLPSDPQQPIRDLDTVRGFLTSSGPIAIADLPWIPVFLLICYLIHPWIGVASLIGAVILITLTLMTERASRVPARAAMQDTGLRATAAEADRRNSESVIAMGMNEALAARWKRLNNRFLLAVRRSTDITNLYGSIARGLRLLLQSAILGLGAYLVIKQEMSAGAMIAASIMMGRALAPIDTAIANWRLFVAARQAMRRLAEVLTRLPPARAATELPPPVRALQVEQVVVAAPGTTALIVGGVNFGLLAGEALGVVGPSGAGKTSLVRTLVGVWPTANGAIRLDGAAINQWDQSLLGRHIGYVSQRIELFNGTISENISRMALEPNAEAVLEAARDAGAHDMILRLAAGYDTVIGDGGTILSGGQQQRIALARALYGKPFLVVLDEPASNLDNDGELALQQSIAKLKARGAIVVLIAHRPSALATCDKVLFVAEGAQRAFGPRDEVLRKILARPGQAPAAPAANLKIVGDTSGGSER